MYYCPTGRAAGRPLHLSEVLSRGHQIDVRAQLERPDGTVLVSSLEVLGGRVTVDRSAAVRRRLAADLAPFTLEASRTITAEELAGAPGSSPAPEPLGDYDSAWSIRAAGPQDYESRIGDVAPYGVQARVFRGVRLPGWYADDPSEEDIIAGGSFYYFPLGVFRLSDTSVNDDGVANLQVDGYDHSRTVARNRFAQPWIVAKGTNVGDAIIAVVEDRLPYAESNPHAVEDTFPTQAVVDAGQDPWEAVTGWARSIGHEVYFDADGRLSIDPIDDPSAPVEWTYADGENAIMLGVSSAASDDPGYNGVVLTSESTTLEAPIRAEAWDDDPSSPTYYLGDYGMVPKFVSNPYVATQAQADAAAEAELERVLGATQRLSFVAVPNAAHEAGDKVRVVRAAARIDREASIETMTIPLTAVDSMSVTTKESLTGDEDDDD